MKFLRCKLCQGEVDVIGNDHSFHKKTKCSKCGYSTEPVGTEVLFINRRKIIRDFGGEI